MDKQEVTTLMKSEIKALKNQMEKTRVAMLEMRRLINRRQRALNLYTQDFKETKKEEAVLQITQKS